MKYIDTGVYQSMLPNQAKMQTLKHNTFLIDHVNVLFVKSLQITLENIKV